MSATWEINKPNGKSSQTFKCLKPWEGKHIAGVQHKKQREFADRFGVIITDSKHHKCGSFSISGNPRKVDETIVAMSEWLKETQGMYFDKF